MKIDKQNGNVAFAEDEHVYWDVTDSSKKYISVTTLIHNYTKPFNKEFWSAYKALEKLIPKESWAIEKKSLLATKRFNKEILNIYDISENDFNKTQQDILDKWQKENMEACERGTKIHAQMENSMYSDNVSLKKFGIGGKFIGKKNYCTLDLENAVYPEYLIYRVSDDGILRIAGQIDLLIKQGNEIILADYKGLPLDTPILTSNGWSTMKDLKVGDKVFDKDGNLCNITVKSSIHHNPCYKIYFKNSETITADIDHRWLISFKTGKSKKHPSGYKEVVMSTIELKTYLESIASKRTSTNIPKILNAKPLNTAYKNLLIDPYVLGVWLGDGSKECGIITQQKGSPVWLELESRGYELGPNLNHDPDRANVEMRTVYGLRSQLKSLGLLGNKHIPDDYQLAAYEQRLDLLRGIMDTDGYYHPTRKRFVMNTSQEWQVKDLNKLLATLGVKSTIFSVNNTFDGKKFPGWHLCFTTNSFNPFLTRNQEIENEIKKDCSSFRAIVKIEEVETVPTQCIAVDSPSHTYLAGESCIVTHNTNKKIDLKGGFDTKTKKTDKMLYPLGKLDDCNFNHYTLQLSTYAWMLQKLNPDFIIKDLILYHFDHNGNETLYHCDYLKSDVENMLYHYKKQVIREEQRNKVKPIEY